MNSQLAKAVTLAASMVQLLKAKASNPDQMDLFGWQPPAEPHHVAFDRHYQSGAVGHVKQLGIDQQPPAKTVTAQPTRDTQPRPAPAKLAVPARKTTSHSKTASSSTGQKTATYKGTQYKLLFLGDTKFGKRAHLQFFDGSKDFWVDASHVTVGSTSSKSTGGRDYPGKECPVCGSEDLDRNLHCWECGYTGRRYH